MANKYGPHYKNFVCSEVGFAVGKKDAEVPILSGSDTTNFGLTIGTRPTQTADGQVDGTGYDLYSATNTLVNALEVNSDFGGNASWGTRSNYVAGIRSSIVFGTAPGGNNTSAIGVLGMLNTNTVGLRGGDKYGVRGHVDFWGSSTQTGTNYNVGALSAYVEHEATTTIDAGAYLCGLCVYQVGSPTITAGVFPAGGLNPAIWIRANAAASAWQTGLYMPVNSVETGIRIGNWVAAGAAGSAIPFAAVQNVYSDGQLDLVAAFGESTSDLTGAYSAKVGRYRHVVTGSSTTIDHETYGLVGQLVGKSVTLTHMHAGLMGTFEGNTTAVVCNSSRFSVSHAAVLARVGGGGLITATTPLAGFLAFWNGAALVTGTGAAFATSYLTAPWVKGFYIPSGSVTTGIEMTSVAKGISSTVSTCGATANGHEFYVTVANPNNQSGTSAYFDSTYTGATAGHCYGVGSWINAGASVFSASHIIVPFEGGVYTSGANSNARIVFGGQFHAILNNAPASLHAFRLNTATNSVTAIFAAASPQSVGYTAGSGTSGAQVGYIPIADIVGPGVVYIRVYSSAT